MTPTTAASRGLVRALLLSTVLCAVFYAYSLYQARELVHSYLPWNLFLAWIPLGLALVLVRLLRRHAWSDWLPILLTLVWLLFLPNSFYLVSDYIHLQDIPTQHLLYDSVMFTMFVFTGLCLGFCSLYVVHLELLKRLPVKRAGLVIATVLLLCSFAIYIGRDLRWNSWDVLLSPAGLLFDISSRFTGGSSWTDMVATVAIFFALLGGMYFVAWRLARLQYGVAVRDNEPRL
jgi:uncharacterized membrane protein